MAASRSQEGSLGDGMVIAASVRARLFGMKLLRIDADVTVSPTSPRVTVRRRSLPAGESETAALLPAPPLRLERTNGSASRRNGHAGSGLDAAARALEASATELIEARRRMP